MDECGTSARIKPRPDPKDLIIFSLEDTIIIPATTTSDKDSSGTTAFSAVATTSTTTSTLIDISSRRRSHFTSVRKNSLSLSTSPLSSSPPPQSSSSTPVSSAFSPMNSFTRASSNIIFLSFIIFLSLLSTVKGKEPFFLYSSLSLSSLSWMG